MDIKQEKGRSTELELAQAKTKQNAQQVQEEIEGISEQQQITSVESPLSTKPANFPKIKAIGNSNKFSKNPISSTISKLVFPASPSQNQKTQQAGTLTSLALGAAMYLGAKAAIRANSPKAKKQKQKRAKKAEEQEAKKKKEEKAEAEKKQQKASIDKNLKDKKAYVNEKTMQSLRNMPGASKALKNSSLASTLVEQQLKEMGHLMSAKEIEELTEKARNPFKKADKADKNAKKNLA